MTHEDKSTKIKQEMETKTPNRDRTITYNQAARQYFYSRRILRLFTDDHTLLY